MLHADGPTPVHDSQIGSAVSPTAKLEPFPARFGAGRKRSVCARTWAVSVERGGQLRFFGLDGVESTGGPVLDFDGDGAVDDRLMDVNRDGLADRVLAGERAHVDTDGDGRWDLVLSDTDGDGLADSAG